MALVIANPPSFYVETSTSLGSVGANFTRLASFTVAPAQPSMHFHVTPAAALEVGLVLGTPYCTTAGTVIVPHINPTGGAVDQIGLTYKIVGF